MIGALLIFRVFCGLGLAAHGAQKLFGWFGGHGLGGTAGFFEKVGFRPGRPFALLAGLGEFGGGLLTALGLFGPVGPALMFLVMVVAAITVHARNGFFTANNGVEMPLLYGIGGLALAFIGPGPYSLDSALGLSVLSTPRDAAIAVAAALIIGLANVALRRAPATAKG